MTHDPVITEAMIEAGGKAVRQFVQIMPVEESAKLIYLAMHRANPVVDVEGMGWQPIETAPLEGHVILYWPEIPGYAEHVSIAAHRGGPFRHPTHWMPLPAPPAIEALNSQGGV